MEAKQLIEDLMKLSNEEREALMGGLVSEVSKNYRLTLVKADITITPFNTKLSFGLNRVGVMYMKDAHGITEKQLTELANKHLDGPLEALAKDIAKLKGESWEQ